MNPAIVNRMGAVTDIATNVKPASNEGPGE
jgi:hypothetical protein